MPLVATDRFASTAAAGADWRDCGRKIAESLKAAPGGAGSYNLGFLYITDFLAKDAGSLLNLLKSVTGVPQWIGTVGLGVCAADREYIDEPAAAVLLGRFDANDLRVFSITGGDMTGTRAVLDPWLAAQDPGIALVHLDAEADRDLAAVLNGFSEMSGAFMTGGLSSSRAGHVQFAGDVIANGLSGALFSQNVMVASGITQGCTPIGPRHTVTKGERHILMELDGRRAFDVFAEDLRAMVEAQRGETLPSTTINPTDTFEHILDSFSDHPRFAPPESLFKGEVHVAFPVSGSDQRDYMVRNALGIDPEKGWIVIAQTVNPGDQLLFVHRDNETIRADLTRMLVDLRERVRRERGSFSPRGAVYVSCVARAMTTFSDGRGGEMALIREILGEIPLAGFYANGEISNQNLHGYTGILTLFL